MPANPPAWLSRAAARVLGPAFVRTYLRPLRFRSRAPYDSKTFWNSRYAIAVGRDAFTDATTIRLGTSPARARYHYNAVENGILEALLADGDASARSILDVGSGAGHWIDFYREALGAEELVGVELSEPGAAELGRRYADSPDVTVVEGDVSEPGFDLGRTFELASAVDVLFHVVSDEDWGRALDNLARHLVPGGRLVVAEHVGLVTKDAGLHKLDRFESPEEARAADVPVMLVGKRIRSRRHWRERARAAGLDLERSVGIRRARGISIPANRVLLFRKT